MTGARTLNNGASASSRSTARVSRSRALFTSKGISTSLCARTWRLKRGGGLFSGGYGTYIATPELANPWSYV